MKYLRKLLGLCNHNWEIYETCTVKRYGIFVSKIYLQKCKDCGKLHSHKIVIE